MKDRNKVFASYSGKKSAELQRYFTTYDRYGDCESMMGLIGSACGELSYLDFGCGAGDYGIKLLMAGANVVFCDTDLMLDFVKYRCKKGGLEAKFYKVGTPPNHLYGKKDVVVFGEVLDHLEDPLKELRMCHKYGVRWLWTTSYPYRSDDYNDDYWQRDDHLKGAFDQQKECREFLEKHYDFEKADGELRLWEIKK